MSLTFPNAKHSHKENWLYILYSDTTASTVVTRFAHYETTVDSELYYPVVLNKANIRDSISLENSKAQTSNISLSIANAQIDGNYLSEAIFGHDRVCINKRVKIYSQINDASALSDCVQIYDGRLTEVVEDIDKLKLSIVAYRPFENISVGIEKPTGGDSTYVPVAYGDYDANAGAVYSSINIGSHELLDDFNKKSYRKVPMLYTRSGDAYFIHGKRNVSSGARIAFYDSNVDKFIPCASGDDNSVDMSNSHYATKVDKEFKRSFFLRPSEASITNKDDDCTIADLDKIYNNNDSDPATFTFTFSGGASTAKQAIIDLPLNIPDGKFSGEGRIYIKAKATASGTGVSVTDFSPRTAAIAGNGSDSASITLSTSDTTTTNGDDTLESFPSSITLTITLQRGSGNVNAATVIVYIYAVYMKSTFQTDADQDKNIIWGYTAADGLTESYSGGNSSTTLSIGPKIYRDLLARFTDYDVADGSLENWSDIISAKASWTMRVSVTEPTELEKILNTIQYESGFIFTRSMTGDKGKFVYVKDSYSSGDVDYTISQDDISNFSIKHRKLNNVITQMEIDSDFNPGKNTYFTRKTSTNAVTKENLFGSGANENIKTMQLEYLYAPIINSADPRTDNPNSSFAAYYNQIIGDTYPNVSFSLHNPEMYGVEVGDIVQFSDLANSKPLGNRWTDQYYMITNVQRQIGTLNIEAYWVYGLDPSPTVTYPDGGETLYAGYTHNILWDWNVQSERSAKITLYKGGSSDSVLSSATPNDGLYAHAIAINETAASDYKIRVESGDSSSIYDESDANFSIATPSITVTNPSSSDTFEPGESTTIQWNSTVPSGATIKLVLYKSITIIETITSSTANDGSYAYTFPGGLANGNDYKIRAYDNNSTSGTTVLDDSSAFSIQAS